MTRSDCASLEINCLLRKVTEELFPLQAKDCTINTLEKLITLHHTTSSKILRYIFRIFIPYVWCTVWFPATDFQCKVRKVSETSNLMHWWLMILQVRLTPLKGSEDLVAKELCFKLFSTKTFNRTDGPQTIQVDGWVQKTRIEPSTIDFILRLKKKKQNQRNHQVHKLRSCTPKNNFELLVVKTYSPLSPSDSLFHTASMLEMYHFWHLMALLRWPVWEPRLVHLLDDLPQCFHIQNHELSEPHSLYNTREWVISVGDKEETKEKTSSESSTSLQMQSGNHLSTCTIKSPIRGLEGKNPLKPSNLPACRSR